MASVKSWRAWLLLPPLLACVGPDAERKRERERVELTNRIVELEQENARLVVRVSELEEAVVAGIGDDFQLIQCPVFPLVVGRVLVVHPDRKRILLDKGARDGVKAGFLFDVYSGSTYKGQVRVTEVDVSAAFAEILSQKNPFAPGDSATTQL